MNICSSISVFIAIFGLCCLFNESIGGDDNEHYEELSELYDLQTFNNYNPLEYSNWNPENEILYDQQPPAIEQSIDYSNWEPHAVQQSSGLNWGKHLKQAAAPESSKNEKSKKKPKSNQSLEKITQVNNANACYVCKKFFEKERKATKLNISKKIQTPSVKCIKCGNLFCKKIDCTPSFTKNGHSAHCCMKCWKNLTKN